MNDNFHPNQAAFILFIASGFGFSAFPVLATLLNAMDLLNKPIGIQTISLAAVEDIVVWIILAIASAFSSGGSALKGLYTLLLTLGFIAIMILIIRPILKRVHGYYLRRNNDTNVYLVVGCFLLLVVSAFTTEVMGIHAFFGAFISGLCIPRKGELTDFLGVRIELIIVEFFLPLYFANSGLQTQLNLLTSGKVWWTLVVLLIIASTAKIVPVSLMTKLCTKKPWSYCFSIGVLMNTRGIVQLVVLNIGVELKVISPIIFALFVLMATILTFATSPILYLLYRKNFDRKKLSAPHLAEDLQLIREADVNPNEMRDSIQTISNDEMEMVEKNRSSSVFMTQMSRNTSVVGPPVTIDERFNYPEINPNSDIEQLVVIGNIVTMPTCPRRVPTMTHF
ncbi:hypothetical protein I4U23_024435 [Adineta vaga]|nr:hypothetical protein I4U23_024435 [Adineta vaga]